MGASPYPTNILCPPIWTFRHILKHVALNLICKQDTNDDYCNCLLVINSRPYTGHQVIYIMKRQVSIIMESPSVYITLSISFDNNFHFNVNFNFTVVYIHAETAIQKEVYQLTK
jgi:hypothetical protein